MTTFTAELTAIETKYPGWRVRWDGKRVRILATRIFTAAEVQLVKMACHSGEWAADAVTLDAGSPELIEQEIALWQHQRDLAARRTATAA